MTTRVGSKADEYFKEAKCHRILIQSKKNQSQVYFDTVSTYNSSNTFNQTLINIFKTDIPQELQDDLTFTKKYFQLLLQRQNSKNAKKHLTSQIAEDQESSQVDNEFRA